MNVDGRFSLKTRPNDYLAMFEVHYGRLLTMYDINRERADRFSGFYIIFKTLLEKKQSDFCIVETGTLRDPGNWSDGQSTHLLYEFLTVFGGSLTTIDISRDNIENCKGHIDTQFKTHGQATIDYRVGNSVEVLKDIDTSVDLLYLDSYDFDPQEPFTSMNHHMMELISSYKILSRSRSLIVAVDDNFKLPENNGGKGLLVKNWAFQTHQHILHDGYQFVFQVG